MSYRTVSRWHKGLNAGSFTHCAGGKFARAHEMMDGAFSTMDPTVDRVPVVSQGLVHEEEKLSWSKDFI